MLKSLTVMQNDTIPKHDGNRNKGNTLKTNNIAKWWQDGILISGGTENINMGLNGFKICQIVNHKLHLY